MCGRIALYDSPEQLTEHFNLSDSFVFKPSYNIAPAVQICTITADEQNHRHLRKMRWGFTPAWAAKGALNFKPINAKSESVASNPMYRSAFKVHRCIIPISGFYEWTEANRIKYPWYISLKSGEPMALAGIWDTPNPKSENTEESCCIITTSANELMKQIHERMPVILPKNLWETWLSPDIHEPQQLLPMLHPHDHSTMQAWRVSRDVNKTGQRDDAGLLEQLSEPD